MLADGTYCQALGFRFQNAQSGHLPRSHLHLSADRFTRLEEFRVDAVCADRHDDGKRPFIHSVSSRSKQIATDSVGGGASLDVSGVDG